MALEKLPHIQPFLKSRNQFIYRAFLEIVRRAKHGHELTGNGADGGISGSITQQSIAKLLTSMADFVDDAFGPQQHHLGEFGCGDGKVVYLAALLLMNRLDGCTGIENDSRTHFLATTPVQNAVELLVKVPETAVDAHLADQLCAFVTGKLQFLLADISKMAAVPDGITMMYCFAEGFNTDLIQHVGRLFRASETTKAICIIFSSAHAGRRAFQCQDMAVVGKAFEEQYDFGPVVLRMKESVSMSGSGAAMTAYVLLKDPTAVAVEVPVAASAVNSTTNGDSSSPVDAIPLLGASAGLRTRPRRQCVVRDIMGKSGGRHVTAVTAIVPGMLAPKSMDTAAVAMDARASATATGSLGAQGRGDVELVSLPSFDPTAAVSKNYSEAAAAEVPLQQGRTASLPVGQRILPGHEAEGGGRRVSSPTMGCLPARDTGLLSPTPVQPRSSVTGVMGSIHTSTATEARATGTVKLKRGAEAASSRMAVKRFRAQM